MKGKHELHLLTFAQTREEFNYKSELEKIFNEVHLIYLPKWRSALNCISALWNHMPLQILYFSSAAMRSAVDKMLSNHNFDAVHVQHLRMSPYFLEKKNIPRILDMPDAFSLYWERRKKIQNNVLLKVFESFEQKRVLKYEQVMKEYNLSLACSQEDIDYLKNLHHIESIKLLPNGVDLEMFKAGNHDYGHNHTLLFTGNMDYAPNVDAVVYFVDEILPLVKKQHPHVRFVIAGQRPVKKVTDLASDSIIITGFVKDLAAVYNDASVVVAPLRFGAGTQNKVLESMAMGIPVVCSNVGFKGLGISSGEGAIMQTEKEKFAASIIALLDSERMRKEVGMKGVSVIQKRFGWDAIAVLLESYLSDISTENRL